MGAALLARMELSCQMPKGPKGQKRPADVVGNAIHVARIATGEETEELTDDGKNAAAVALGKRGGQARAKSLTAKQKKEIAIKAAKKRWKNKD
jgi:hypothetical protein